MHPLQATRPTCRPFFAAKLGRIREICVRQQRVLPQAKQSQEEGGNIQLPGSIQHINKCCSACVLHMALAFAVEFTDARL